MEKPKPPKMRKVIQGLFVYKDVTDLSDDEIQKLIKKDELMTGVLLGFYIVLCFLIGIML